MNPTTGKSALGTRLILQRFQKNSINDFHRFVGSGGGAGSFPEQRVPTDNENRREMAFKVWRPFHI